jgi:hypothetical protein
MKPPKGCYSFYLYSEYVAFDIPDKSRVDYYVQIASNKISSRMVRYLVPYQLPVVVFRSSSNRSHKIFLLGVRTRTNVIVLRTRSPFPSGTSPFFSSSSSETDDDRRQRFFASIRPYGSGDFCFCLSVVCQR